MKAEKQGTMSISMGTKRKRYLINWDEGYYEGKHSKGCDIWVMPWRIVTSRSKRKKIKEEWGGKVIFGRGGKTLKTLNCMFYLRDRNSSIYVDTWGAKRRRALWEVKDFIIRGIECSNGVLILVPRKWGPI